MTIQSMNLVFLIVFICSMMINNLGQDTKQLCRSETKARNDAMQEERLNKCPYDCRLIFVGNPIVDGREWHSFYVRF